MGKFVLQVKIDVGIKKNTKYKTYANCKGIIFCSEYSLLYYIILWKISPLQTMEFSKKKAKYNQVRMVNYINRGFISYNLQQLLSFFFADD